MTGLILDPAAKQYVIDTAAPVPRLLASATAPADDFDPTNVVFIESQLNFNSCVGNSLSSVAEYCYFIDTKGLQIQFSRWLAYLWSQAADGNFLGKDQGATQRGGIITAERKGFVPETALPYPKGRYNTNIPPGMDALAAPNRITTHSMARTWDDHLQWNRLGKGCTWVCINWTERLANGTSPITKYDLGGRSLGGHAVYLAGWTKNGLSYLINSHDKSWGKNGVRLVTPEAGEIWAREGDLCMMSDLKDIDVNREVIDFGSMF